MGHTFPGAVAPFGMVQLSPDTRLVPYAQENGAYNPEVYEYCAGYQFDDTTVFGFSHTHFSGTGHSDLGDIGVLPVRPGSVLNPGDGQSESTGFFDRMNKSTEAGEPGYYRVDLIRSGVAAELTASTRVGMHRYTANPSDSQAVIFDLVSSIYGYDGKVLWASVRVENDTLITGYRHVSGWARDRYVYFAAAFSRPVVSYRHENADRVPYRGFYKRFNEGQNFAEMAGRELRAEFTFAPSSEPLVVAVALSGVSTQGALANLKAECQGMDFDKVRAATQAQWESQLDRVEATFYRSEDRTTFYTALYHSFLAPHVFEDVDGSYRGLDGNVHQSPNFTNLTVFSVWDTYRALHPWFNLVQPEHSRDAVASMLAHSEQSVHKVLPVWSHWANENWCMIGYHSVSVLADAKAKGIGGIDYRRAASAAVRSSQWRTYDGLGSYMDLGFVPEDEVGSSVSKTLEYAYDDWCVAQLTEGAEKGAYEKRASNYTSTFDSSIKWARPRFRNGAFKKEFDLLSTHNQGFIEGNAWNYSFYVPHDVPGLVAQMGGPKIFERRLDSLFTMELPDEAIAHTEDVTRDGILGNYVHGNEPSHHIPYLYAWTGSPHKTQRWVRHICRTMYGPESDGLCGNDDAGQMSAWYLFSSLGFYPVCPGDSNYILGSPSVTSAVLFKGQPNELRISVRNASERNVYVKSVSLNGQLITDFRLNHHDLIKGGTLEFVLGRNPPVSSGSNR